MVEAADRGGAGRGVLDQPDRVGERVRGPWCRGRSPRPRPWTGTRPSRRWTASAPGTRRNRAPSRSAPRPAAAPPGPARRRPRTSRCSQCRANVPVPGRSVNGPGDGWVPRLLRTASAGRCPAAAATPSTHARRAMPRRPSAATGRPAPPPRASTSAAAADGSWSAARPSAGCRAASRRSAGSSTRRRDRPRTASTSRPAKVRLVPGRCPSGSRRRRTRRCVRERTRQCGAVRPRHLEARLHQQDLVGCHAHGPSRLLEVRRLADPEL